MSETKGILGDIRDPFLKKWPSEDSIDLTNIRLNLEEAWRWREEGF